MARRIVVTYTLTEAWESWIADVPDGTTNEQILSGEIEPDFVELSDSGNSTMGPTTIEDLELT